MKIKGFLIHCCLFDPWCWKNYYRIATPMRLHIGTRHWTLLSNWKRFERLWGPSEGWPRRRSPKDP